MPALRAPVDVQAPAARLAAQRTYGFLPVGCVAGVDDADENDSPRAAELARPGDRGIGTVRMAGLRAMLVLPRGRRRGELRRGRRRLGPYVQLLGKDAASRAPGKRMTSRLHGI